MLKTMQSFISATRIMLLIIFINAECALGQHAFVKYHPFGTNYDTWTFHASTVIGNNTYYSLDFVCPNGCSLPLYTIVKINNEGEVVWAKRYTSTAGVTGRYYDIEATSDSNLVFSIDNNSTNICLVKIDTAGNVLWANGYSAPSIYGQTLLTTDSTGIYAAVKLLSGGIGFFKTDNNGLLVPGSFTIVSVANQNFIELIELNLDNSGNRYLSGLIITTQTDTLAMLKINQSNTLAWFKKYAYGSFGLPFSNSVSYDFASKHWHNKNGNSFYMGGAVVQTNPLLVERAVFKIDTSGTPLWTYHTTDADQYYYFNGEGDAGVQAIFSTGFVPYRYIISSIDSGGNLLWSRRSNLNNIGYGVNKLSNGDLMVYGEYVNFPANSLDFMMAKHLSYGANCSDSIYLPPNGMQTTVAIQQPGTQTFPSGFNSLSVSTTSVDVPLPSVIVCDVDFTSLPEIRGEARIKFSGVSNGNSIIAFNVGHEKNGELSVHDFSGKRLYEKQMRFHGNETSEIILPDLNNGIYFIQFLFDDIFITQKFVVIK